MSESAIEWERIWIERCQQSEAVQAHVRDLEQKINAHGAASRRLEEAVAHIPQRQGLKGERLYDVFYPDVEVFMMTGKNGKLDTDIKEKEKELAALKQSRSLANDPKWQNDLLERVLSVHDQYHKLKTPIYPAPGKPMVTKELTKMREASQLAKNMVEQQIKLVTEEREELLQKNALAQKELAKKNPLEKASAQQQGPFKQPGSNAFVPPARPGPPNSGRLQPPRPPSPEQSAFQYPPTGRSQQAPRYPQPPGCPQQQPSRPPPFPPQPPGLPQQQPSGPPPYPPQPPGRPQQPSRPPPYPPQPPGRPQQQPSGPPPFPPPQSQKRPGNELVPNVDPKRPRPIAPQHPQQALISSVNTIPPKPTPAEITHSTERPSNPNSALSSPAVGVSQSGVRPSIATPFPRPETPAGPGAHPPPRPSHRLPQAGAPPQRPLPPARPVSPAVDGPALPKQGIPAAKPTMPTQPGTFKEW